MAGTGGKTKTLVPRAMDADDEEEDEGEESSSDDDEVRLPTCHSSSQICCIGCSCHHQPSELFLLHQAISSFFPAGLVIKHW